MLQQTYLSKHETLTQCWSTVGRFYLQTGRIRIPDYFNHLYYRKTNTTHHRAKTSTCIVCATSEEMLKIVAIDTENPLLPKGSKTRSNHKFA